MHQIALEFPLAERLESDNFIISSANAEAYAFLDAWPNWPSCGLILHGPEASGKTHLAKIWLEKAGAHQLDAQEIVTGLNSLSPCILVENAETIADQELFFHFLNHIQSHKGWLLLTSRLPLSSWGISLPDLLSRLKVFPTAELYSPDDILLAGVISKHFNDRQIFVPEEVVTYLISHMERSLATAKMLATNLDQLALAEKKPVTLHLVRKMMDDINLT